MTKQKFKITEESINKVINKGINNGYFINGGEELFREMLREIELEISK